MKPMYSTYEIMDQEVIYTYMCMGPYNEGG